MMGTAARRVPLFMRDHEAWAHGVIFRALAFCAPALADANAAQGRVREAAVIVRKFEVGFWIPGPVIGAEPQVFIHSVRINNFARIHFPVWVPNRLELAKGLKDLPAKHFVEELGASLAVSVLPAQAAAVLDAEVGRFFHEGAPLSDSSGAGDIEVHATMDAALTEMTIKGRVVLVFVVEGAQLA